LLQSLKQVAGQDNTQPRASCHFGHSYQMPAIETYQAISFRRLGRSYDGGVFMSGVLSDLPYFRFVGVHNRMRHSLQQTLEQGHDGWGFSFQIAPDFFKDNLAYHQLEHTHLG